MPTTWRLTLRRSQARNADANMRPSVRIKVIATRPMSHHFGARPMDAFDRAARIWMGPAVRSAAQIIGLSLSIASTGSGNGTWQPKTESTSRLVVNLKEPGCLV